MKALVLSVACAGLALLPLGGRSKSSEVELRPYLPRSAHQAYGYSLALAGLGRGEGLAWVEASERALTEPEPAALPFGSSGRFTAADARGFRFSTPGGRRVLIEVETAPAEPGGPRPAVFVDLFDAPALGAERLESAPPAREGSPPVQRIELAVLEPSEYVLRVQPELGFAGEYRVTIRAEPLLAFPVEGVGPRAILSGFGAERDGGARSHHGVDIFAPRGTPAVAAMDAWVSRVETTPRGGNVVWLQPLFGDLRLYYAHLDSQLVSAGELVLAGEVVGTVGNTGNARTTPPHLHFGVYIRARGMRGGPRDPYPFLD